MNQKVSVLILHSSVTSQIEKLATEMKDEFILAGYQVELTDNLRDVSEEALASYDLVCVGTEQGNRDLLNLAGLFDHPNLAAFASCRSSLFSLRKKAEKSNARISDLALFPVKKGLISSLNSWITYNKYGDSNPDHKGFDMYPFGISDEELERARDFAKNLITQLVIRQEAHLVYS